jgi:hypothetical protein
MSPAEIQVKINLAQREADYWREIIARKSCEDCKQWQHSACSLAGGVVPPDDVVRVGCDNWSWDEIPF